MYEEIAKKENVQEENLNVKTDKPKYTMKKQAQPAGGQDSIKSKI